MRHRNCRTGTLARPKSMTGRSARPTKRVARHGFTLIEMMISVGLVLLMMSLFAQIFQTAGGAISKQRGLMENDQRARTLQTIIKGDLDKRTFRKVLGFAANEDTAGVEAEISKRRGYFYYSENDPNNQLDDVLQFTMQSSIVVYNKDASPYYGRALQLTSFNHPNQPDTDDAQLVPNNTGLSTLAEVSYFVRNGSLYRRQLLIREPIPVAGSTKQPQDATVNTVNFFDPTASPAPFVLYPSGVSGATTFWDDFDYSAFLTINGGGSETGAMFLGSNSLNNDGTSTVQLGLPWVRFGHNALGGPATANFGSPKEYAGTTATPAFFIGRYTLQECSDLDFKYPQSRWGTTNPMNISTTSLTLDPVSKMVTATSPGTSVDLTSGLRRGEDLLMSNVHSFDVQLWDDAAGVSGLGAFVDIGGSGAVDYAMTNNKHLNPIYGGGALLYGPTTSASTNRVFDTWHPQFNLTTTNDSPLATGQTIYDDPPFRPYKQAVVSVAIGGPYQDYEEWQPNTSATAASRYGASPPPSKVFPRLAVRPYGNPFYYVCVGTNDINMDGTISHGMTEPSWPRIDGLRVKDGELVWQAVENRKPLKAIKLEIRFVDTSTQQMRQLTIIQSLAD